jgi:hypothetical protein
MKYWDGAFYSLEKTWPHCLMMFNGVEWWFNGVCVYIMVFNWIVFLPGFHKIKSMFVWMGVPMCLFVASCPHTYWFFFDSGPRVPLLSSPSHRWSWKKTAKMKALKKGPWSWRT